MGGIKDAIDTAATRTDLILDEAIAKLNNAQADWQNILKDTTDKLTSDAQSTVRNEVNVLLQRGIAATGAELRCNADFVVNRLRQGLIRIKQAFLHQPVDPVEPQLCNVIPLAVDRALVPDRLNRLEFVGYDFDTTPITVLLSRSNGSTVDVSNMLNRPTHYHMTLTVGGPNGVPLAADSQRLLLKWNNKEISSIAVIQPATPVCKTQIVQRQPGSLSFIPPHTRGDREFNGNGPEITAEVRLNNLGTSVTATTFMRAKETKSDWTTAQGSRTDTVFVPDPGWRVTQLLVGAQSGCPAFASCWSYTDSDHAPDIFAAGNGPVSRFEFVGDTGGDEAGTRTGVTVTFNNLRFEVTESRNCVSPNALKELEKTRLISPVTRDRFRTVIERPDPN